VACGILTIFRKLQSCAGIPSQVKQKKESAATNSIAVSCDYHPTVVRSEGEIGSMPMYDKGILGAQLPQDRLYHRGHTWVRREEDGTYTIGLDDFIHRLIGNPDRIDLPAPGAHLHANGTGWIMKKKRSRLRVLAPIDCVVIAQGSIEKGWLLKVRTDEAPLRLGHLLRGEEIAPWIMHEAERLEKMFEMAHVGCTLADGESSCLISTSSIQKSIGKASGEICC